MKAEEKLFLKEVLKYDPKERKSCEDILKLEYFKNRTHWALRH